MEFKTIPQTRIWRTGLKGCWAHVFQMSSANTSHIFPSTPQKKDLWRFLWDYVVPQEGSKRNQDHWQCPVYICCLGCSQVCRKWFICPSVKKPPLPPKHPWASPIWPEGKCVPDPKSGDYVMHPEQQIGAPANLECYPWSCCKLCLLLQKETRRKHY